MRIMNLRFEFSFGTQKVYSVLIISSWMNKQPQIIYISLVDSAEVDSNLVANY